MLDQETAVVTARRYAEEVIRHMSPASIVLFGSYAKGRAHEDSDIDVAVIFNRFEGDWLEASAQLWGLTRNISTYIEPVLLDRFDDPSGFVDEVYKTGHILYSA